MSGPGPPPRVGRGDRVRGAAARAGGRVDVVFEVPDAEALALGRAFASAGDERAGFALTAPRGARDELGRAELERDDVSGVRRGGALERLAMCRDYS